MTVNVTQEDIEQGTTGEVSCCPVALAVLRTYAVEYNKPIMVSVMFRHISIRWNDAGIPEYLFDTLLETRDFIKRFDAGDTVEPFSFELPDIQKTVTLKELADARTQFLSTVGFVPLEANASSTFK